MQLLSVWHCNLSSCRKLSARMISVANDSKDVKDYQRLYYAQNKDKIKVRKGEYYSRNLNKIKESTRLYRLRNPNEKAESLRQYCEQNRSKLLEYHRNYNPTYRLLNKAKLKEMKRRQYLRNHKKPEAYVARNVTKSWSTPCLVREHFDSLAKQLFVSSHEDWYRISRGQIVSLGGTARVFHL